MSKETIGCLRKIFLDDNCFCNLQSNSTSASNTQNQHQHSPLCKKITSHYRTKVRGPDIIKLLTSTISVIPNSMDSASVPTLNEQEEQEALHQSSEGQEDLVRTGVARGEQTSHGDDFDQEMSNASDDDTGTEEEEIEESDDSDDPDYTEERPTPRHQQRSEESNNLSQ